MEPKRRRWRVWLRRGCLLSALLGALLVLLVVLAVFVWLPNAVREAGDNLVVTLTQRVIPDMLERAEGLEIPPPEVPVRPALSTPIVSEPFAFSPEAPTLLVLVHGATRPPAPDNGLNTLVGARAYWGYGFLRALLGGGAMQTMAGQPLSSESWGQLPDGPPSPEAQLVLAEGQDARLVLLTYRDGSGFLGPQSAALVDQVYDAYQRLFADSERPPQIVWLAHSMGGLVTRYLLSDPDVSDEGFALGLDVRERAAFLRERTLYLVTLSTPHEGSRAADNVGVIQQITTLPDDLFGPNLELEAGEGEALTTAALGFLRAYQPSTQHLRSDVWRQLNDPDSGLVAPQLARRADGSLIPVYALSGRTPAGGFFADPNFAFGPELSLLSYAAEGSPHPKLLADTLSMVMSDYLLYNTPGIERGWGRVTAGLEPFDRVARTSLSSPVEARYDGRETAFESFPIYFLNQSWSHLEEAGEPSTELEATLRQGFAALFSSFRQAEDLLALLPEDSSLANPEAIRQRYDEDRLHQPEAGAVGDGFIDGDGVVALDSGLGFTLGTGVPDFFSHGRVWPISGETLRGSWYRIYDAPYSQRADGTFPWEWANHSLVQYDPEVAAWLADNVLTRAGPYVGPDPYSGWVPALNGGADR